MYLILPAILLLLILCSFLFVFRRKCIIKKISCMPIIDKMCLLNKLLAPFGFQYILSQDIFTSCLSAWQRDYGYHQIYDKKAPHFNIVFDCEPIYFDYNGCTWLLEFWKGQYGINTGAEIGIYKADRIISCQERDRTLFHTVEDCELPKFALTLIKNGDPCVYLERTHWWLTAFLMGDYSEPCELCVEYDITFPSAKMCDAFVNALLNAGYTSECISACCAAVSFTFSNPVTPQPASLRPLLCRFAQWKNRMFLRLYRWATRPFCLTLDRLLYLYEYMPFAFRHMICLKNMKKKRHKRRALYGDSKSSQ